MVDKKTENFSPSSNVILLNAVFLAEDVKFHIKLSKTRKKIPDKYCDIEYSYYVAGCENMEDVSQSSSSINIETEETYSSAFDGSTDTSLAFSDVSDRLFW